MECGGLPPLCVFDTIPTPNSGSKLPHSRWRWARGWASAGTARVVTARAAAPMECGGSPPLWGAGMYVQGETGQSGACS